MVQNRTVLKVIDNSGAKYVRCLKVLNKKKVGYLGDLIIVSVLSLRRGRGRKIRVKRKDLCLVLITSIKYKKFRLGGHFIQSKLNSVVLLNRRKKPIGNRVFGLVFKELRLKKKFKTLSLSSKVI
jgi:large subunit ribosomal protein L14